MTDSNETIKLDCPTCKKLVLWNDDFPHRPFCCDRCRLIDLGEWASETHRIAGPAFGATKMDLDLEDFSED